VDLADGCGRQWPALVALGIPVDAVGAAGEFSVETHPVPRVEQCRAQVADERQDVLAEIAAVAAPGVGAGVHGRDVPLHQVTERGVGAWLAPFLHHGHQPRADYLGLPFRGGTVWDGLGQVVLAAGERIDPRKHSHPQRPARQHRDAATRAMRAGGGVTATGGRAKWAGTHDQNVRRRVCFGGSREVPPNCDRLVYEPFFVDCGQLSLLVVEGVLRHRRFKRMSCGDTSAGTSVPGRPGAVGDGQHAPRMPDCDGT
jgi:hypothetical protein